MDYQAAQQMVRDMEAINAADRKRWGQDFDGRYPHPRLDKLAPGKYAVKFQGGHYIWPMTPAELGNSDLTEW